MNVKLLTFLNADVDGFATKGVTEPGDSENDKGTQAHDGEDVREDCDGVNEFVHCRGGRRVIR